MIIDRLILENFAVYGGRQEMILTPASKERPVVLVHGLNGTGKTSLLDSLHLAFYGSRARTSNRGRLSYKEYLRASINHNADPELGVKVEVFFRRRQEGKECRYHIRRFWSETDGGEVRETFEVIRDDKLDFVLSDHWEEFMESYLPVNIARLFFFDGEQIRRLASFKEAQTLLESAIGALLGVDLIGRLETDLQAVARRLKRASIDEKDREKIEELEKQLQKAIADVDTAREKRAGIVTKLERSRKEQADIEARYRSEGGELFDRQDDLKTTQKLLSQEIEASEETLRDFLGGVGPLAFVLPRLRELHETAVAEKKRSSSILTAQATDERDKILYQQLAEKGLSKSGLKLVEQVLGELDSSCPVSSENQASLFINQDDALIPLLREVIEKQLPPGIEKSASLAKKVTSMREKLTRTEENLAAVPSEESLQKVHHDLIEKRKLVEKFAANLEETDEQIAFLQRIVDTQNSAVQKALDSIIDQLDEIEISNRMISRSEKIRKTLDQFKLRVIAEHTAKIEALIADAFAQLIRKRDLIRAISINPATFEMTLTGADGRVLKWDRLSSGERQLLATAMLWGLARASGRPIPTVIDTPLGRLDSEHRKHLVENYFPSASHQMILLSTDEEISGGYEEMLRPYLGLTYELECDGERTSIRPATQDK